MVSTLPQPTEGGNFTPPPAGTHPAICYRFIDLGTQKGEYQGETKSARKVMVSWEITDQTVRTDDGHAYTISQRFTWSMHEKATLRKTLEAWRGQPFKEEDFGEGGFNVKKLIGVGCLISILHVDKGDKRYANISAIMKLPRGMDAGILTNTPVFFDLDNFDRDVFNSLGDKLQDIIKASPEYQSLGQPKADNGYHAPNFDDVPAGDPGWQPDNTIPF